MNSGHSGSIPACVRKIKTISQPCSFSRQKKSRLDFLSSNIFLKKSNEKSNINIKEFFLQCKAK